MVLCLTALSQLPTAMILISTAIINFTPLSERPGVQCAGSEPATVNLSDPLKQPLEVSSDGLGPWGAEW
jgi:hypothetical protein